MLANERRRDVFLGINVTFITCFVYCIDSMLITLLPPLINSVNYHINNRWVLSSVSRLRDSPSEQNSSFCRSIKSIIDSSGIAEFFIRDHRGTMVDRLVEKMGSRSFDDPLGCELGPVTSWSFPSNDPRIHRGRSWSRTRGQTTRWVEGEKVSCHQQNLPAPAARRAAYTARVIISRNGRS